MDRPPRTFAVLVAEDDRIVRMVIERHLTHLGYRVVPVSDGDQAIARLQEETFDAVILDQVMPGMSGTEICEAIRAEPATEHMPVLMITGRSGQRDVERGFAAGVDEYLTKPFENYELEVAVARLLADRK